MRTQNKNRHNNNRPLAKPLAHLGTHVLHKVHVYDVDANTGDARWEDCVVPVLNGHRLGIMGEIVARVEGADFYARYTLGPGDNHTLERKGLPKAHFVEGGVVIDLDRADQATGDLASRIRQAHRAFTVRRAIQDDVQELTFLHPTAPVGLRHNTKRPKFVPAYKTSSAAEQAATDEVWAEFGLAQAHLLKRVVPEALLVHVPEQRRRWSAYPIELFDRSESSANNSICVLENILNDSRAVFA